MRRSSSSSSRRANTAGSGGGGLLVAGAIAAAFVGVIAHRVINKPPNAPPFHRTFVLDTSVSAATECSALVSMLREQVDGSKVPKDSRFALIAIGSDDNRWEPRLVLDRDIPRLASGATMLSGAGSGQSRESFYEEVRIMCEGLPTARGSSIYRAVAVALDHVQGLCAGVAGCAASIDVATDLEENVQWATGPDSFPKARGGRLRLDNDLAGLEIRFCGYTMTKGAGAARTAGRDLIESWRKMFTRPEAVSFQPYCSAAQYAAR